MENLERLEKAKLFQGLNRAQLAEVKPVFKNLAYRKGAIIFRERQEANMLCLLVSGLVDLRLDQPPGKAAKRSTLTTLEPGLSFGWSALVKPYRYTLTSYCVSETCQVMAAGREDLLALFGRSKEIGLVVMSNLAQVIATRFKALQDKMAQREGFNVRVQW